MMTPQANHLRVDAAVIRLEELRDAPISDAPLFLAVKVVAIVQPVVSLYIKLAAVTTSENQFPIISYWQWDLILSEN